MPPAPSDPVHHPLVRAVAGGLRHRCRVESGSSVVVAVSGGADSVALLRALALLASRRRHGYRITVAHVQHHLRAEAEEDAAFVADLAASLGLPAHRQDVRPGDASGNLENNARRLRYAALARVAQRVGAPVVLTAHQADDQLETMLMRLMRGASLRGLAGIRWRRRLVRGLPLGLARPMLAVPRSIVVDFLNALQQPWREDATNLDTSRWRARLRHDVLPALRSLRPDVASKAGQAADHLAAAGRLVDQQARTLLARTREEPGVTTLPRAAARGTAPLVLQAAVRRLLREAGVPGDGLRAETLQKIVSSMSDRQGNVRTFELAGRVRMTITSETISISKC